MTDSRREFLLRFAATALAAGVSPAASADEPLAKPESPLAVYGPPPNYRARTVLREVEIPFAGEKLEINAQARLILDDLALVLKRETDLAVILEGHADDKGTREYNLAIAERRAELVRHYLVGQGVPEGRMVAISYGKERPLDPARTKAARAANRRVVIRLEPR